MNKNLQAYYEMEERLMRVKDRRFTQSVTIYCESANIVHAFEGYNGGQRRQRQICIMPEGQELTMETKRSAEQMTSFVSYM